MIQGDCSHSEISRRDKLTLPLETGVSPSRALINVDLPQPTGPITKTMSPCWRLMCKLRRTKAPSASQPKLPSRTTMHASELPFSAIDEVGPDFGPLAEVVSGVVRASTRDGRRRNCSTLVRHPRAVIKSSKPEKRLNRGSETKKSKEREVKMRAGSRLVAPFLALPMKIANVMTGETS